MESRLYPKVLAQAFQDRYLPFQGHVAGTIERHPLGTIDLWKLLDVPRLFRPLHSECVAMKPQNVEVTFDRIGGYNFAA